MCAKQLSRLLRVGGGRLLVGGYVPQCTLDGRYTKKQCHPSTGYCWCVNQNDGEEIQGTRTRGVVSCGKGPVKIYRVPRPSFGENLPEKSLRPPFF